MRPDKRDRIEGALVALGGFAVGALIAVVSMWVMRAVGP